MRELVKIRRCTHYRAVMELVGGGRRHSPWFPFRHRMNDWIFWQPHNATRLLYVLRATPHGANPTEKPVDNLLAPPGRHDSRDGS